MCTIAFDTTTAFCSIILMKDKKKIDIFSDEMNFGQSEVLIPQIETMLKKQNLTVKDLSLMVVCTGPGSFTGVRSSIAAARAFGLASKNLTLCGINAFDAYVFNIKNSFNADYIVSLVETKREDFYVCYYDQNLKKIASPKTAFSSDILRDLQQKRLIITGDGAQRFLSKPSGLHICDTIIAPCPPIENIALLGISRFEQKNTDFPKPLYLKAADVCVK